MSDPSRELKTRLYRSVLLIRRAEETLAELYKEQEMRTPTHFGIGQEAVAAGVCGALAPDDVIYSHHRCHNHYLAKGGSLDGLVAELYGRVTGCSGGRGGSVHLTDPTVGVVATSAILGQMVAVATGSALAFKMDGASRVAVAFFGEATLEEGIIYESLNYASLHRLPVLFVCENNLYSTESPIEVRQPRGTSLCERARAFKVRAEELDGNDVFAVHAASRRTLEQMRSEGGPAFLECFTYRWREHVGPHFDHDLGRSYRSRAELEAWMKRCPLKRAEEHLLSTNLTSSEELARWLEETDDRIAEAVAKARAAPFPDPKSLHKNVH